MRQLPRLPRRLPDQAFPAPYQLDARRCISYLTIEHKGPIPRELRAAIGNRIYGCDDCLAVCPWNKFASVGREAKLAARDDLDAPPLAELAALDEAAFRARFAGGPIKRVGRARFLRNVMIAIGNSGDASLIAAARARSRRRIRRWCAQRRYGRLRARFVERELGGACDRFTPGEGDAQTLEEWRVALTVSPER